MTPLQRVDPDSPGWTRRRSGRGFIYLDEHGTPITDEEIKQRCRELVIPPAWEKVWICPEPGGHIQAAGVDDAGRRQYLYHPRWRSAQDALKHRRVLQVAARLPAARTQVQAALGAPGMPRSRALAVAFALLDRGLFRLGTETYTRVHGSFGLATLRKEHLRISRDRAAFFDYPGKAGVRTRVRLELDGELAQALTMLRRRRGGGSTLLAYREPGRRGSWQELTSADISAHVKELLGDEATAKDFRTWHGTVLAAVALAEGPRGQSEAEQRRRIAHAVQTVAEHLGNTPAVSRSAYIDPKVIEAFESEQTIPGGDAAGDASYPEEASSDSTVVAHLDLPTEPEVERQVLRLLRG